MLDLFLATKSVSVCSFTAYETFQWRTTTITKPDLNAHAHMALILICNLSTELSLCNNNGESGVIKHISNSKTDHLVRVFDMCGGLDRWCGGRHVRQGTAAERAQRCLITDAQGVFCRPIGGGHLKKHDQKNCSQLFFFLLLFHNK